MHKTRTGLVLSPPTIDSEGPRFVPDGLAGASLRLTTIAPDSNDFPSDFEISIEAFSNDRITVTGFFLGTWVYSVQKILHKRKVVFALGLLLLLVGIG